MRGFYSILFTACLAFILQACTKDVESSRGKDPYQETILPDISFQENGALPNEGFLADTVLFKGKGFADHRDQLSILFNGQKADVIGATDTTVTVTVPEGASSGAVTAQVGKQYFFGPFFRVFGPLQMDTLFPGFRGANGAIQDILPVENGKYLITGGFTNYDNANIGGGINRVARINADGTLDRTFKYGAATGAPAMVNAGAYLPESGQYLVAGSFNRYGDLAHMSGFARLNFNGSVDSVSVTVPSGDVVWASALRGGVAGTVRQLHVLPDHKYIGVGNFRYYVQVNYDLVSSTGLDSTHLDSIMVNYIARFNEDGSLDSSYNYDGVNHRGKESVNGAINASLLLPDGKLLIAGNFTKYNGQTANRIARLNADGTLDGGFRPNGGADWAINDIEPLPDGRFLLVGAFNAYDGHAAIHVVRINADGSYDPGFDVGKGPDGFVYKAGVLDNGAIILSGTFRKFDDVTCSNFAVLDATGGLHKTYNTSGGLNLGLDAVSGGFNKILQLEGLKAFIAVGNFTEFDYRASNNILRMQYQ
ncbi:DUF5008 domain-containing protein [Compostibacter hankyongensis]|uniref:DUF5124 domain-containing protein n=1 Tax=Compostibacter hankyongensis TaxID=1007089 RepID=A0ABP8FTN9_9BACT